MKAFVIFVVIIGVTILLGVIVYTCLVTKDYRVIITEYDNYQVQQRFKIFGWLDIGSPNCSKTNAIREMNRLAHGDEVVASTEEMKAEKKVNMEE